jgi:hypothetical protein
VYSPNRNPTELYYEGRDERDALLRQEAARNRRLARPLATLSTVLVVLVTFVGLAAIAVGPGRAIDYIGSNLTPVAWILGVLVVLVGLLMLEGGKVPDDGTKPFDSDYWHLW